MMLSPWLRLLPAYKVNLKGDPMMDRISFNKFGNNYDRINWQSQ